MLEAVLFAGTTEGRRIADWCRGKEISLTVSVELWKSGRSATRSSVSACSITDSRSPASGIRPSASDASKIAGRIPVA